MAKTIVDGERTARQTATPIGPYSHGVVARGSQLLFIAGQIAWNSEGTLVGKGDLGAQYRQIMGNIQAIVEDAGGSMADICKIVNYVTTGLEKADAPYRDLSDVRREFIPSEFPVSSLVVVSSLMDPDALVEVDAIDGLD